MFTCCSGNTGCFAFICPFSVACVKHQVSLFLVLCLCFFSNCFYPTLPSNSSTVQPSHTSYLEHKWILISLSFQCVTLIFVSRSTSSAQLKRNADCTLGSEWLLFVVPVCSLVLDIVSWGKFFFFFHSFCCCSCCCFVVSFFGGVGLFFVGLLDLKQTINQSINSFLLSQQI